MHLNDILKTDSHTIIDVRTKEEFESGHVKGAINIPVNLIPEKIQEIEKLPHPIVLCCASGTRSRQAHVFLSQHGIANTYNGGSWLEINELKGNN
jgi:rhodanese-related sulfurtransferase